jgi:hypothetical protein
VSKTDTTLPSNDSFVLQNMVWKDDSGTNRVIKQLVDIKLHIGQQMDDPFRIWSLLANKFQYVLALQLV